MGGHGQKWVWPVRSVLKNWTNGIDWFFACWYKFWKVKSWFNDFCVGLVKNSRGLLVHETLKSTVSYEWIYELNWLIKCSQCCNSFWLDWYFTLYILKAGGPLQLYVLFSYLFSMLQKKLLRPLRENMISLYAVPVFITQIFNSFKINITLTKKPAIWFALHNQLTGFYVMTTLLLYGQHDAAKYISKPTLKALA